MKSIIFVAVFLFPLVISKAKTCAELTFENNSLDLTKIISKKVFNSYLKYFDTTKGKEDLILRRTASCSWGTYKKISAKYIIKINTEVFSRRIENFYEVNIDRSDKKCLVELLIYDKLDAALDNICTDMGDYNNPKATRKLVPKSGKLIIGFTKPTNSHDLFDVSILMQELIFIDTETKQKIKFNKEVVWKTFYDGIPG